MAISVADNFQYLGTKPLDARLKFASVSDMVSTAAASLYDGCFAYVTATKKYYSYDSTNTVDVTLGKWREYSSGGDTIQVDTLPTAGAEELGKVYQYIGSTTLTLTHGYFYECVSDGAGTPTYSWSEVPVQEGSSITVDSAMSDSSVNPVQNKVITAALGNKVDKHQTGGVDDRLMTAAEGTKLSGIAANAEVNVQSDWNQTDTDADDFIKNKPTIPDVSNYVQKSQTAGLLKNDGTVDTHTYVATSSTAGLLKNDGTVDTNTYATTSQIPSVTGKADKVTSATNGNFAGLDSNGNLTDSGKKASDFASASDVHSIPSGGTTGQVLAKSSGTDYAVSWVDAGGGGGGLLWASGTTDSTTNKIPVTLSEVPTLTAGDVIVLQIMANYTMQLSTANESWGIQYTVSGSTTNISDCIFEVYTDSSNKVYFNDDLHKGDVLVLVVKEYVSASKVFVVAAHKTEFEYTEQTATLSTSTTTTVTFTSYRYTTNSTVEVATSEWGLVPDSVVLANGSCTVTLPIASSAHSVTVRVYTR